jgi:hypothetical protein
MNSDGLLTRFGYRFGRSGPHASRTMMLDEMSVLLERVPATAAKSEYRQAVVEFNALGKPTQKARELTFRHLSDLYGLDPTLAVFRVFRQLWNQDDQARPMLTLMIALVRDPLLRASRDFLLAKHPGELVRRDELEALLAKDDPDRFSRASLKSFAQNINGTWTQAGFLAGRASKTRVVPRITPTNVTFALFLGHLEGLSGQRLFTSNWVNLLPGSPDELVAQANSASNRGQIVFMNAGGVKEVRFPGYLLPDEEKSLHE